MSEPDNSHAQAAIQYLTWAIEEIEKAGNAKAADHARTALKSLQAAHPVTTASAITDLTA